MMNRSVSEPSSAIRVVGTPIGHAPRITARIGVPTLKVMTVCDIFQSEGAIGLLDESKQDPHVRRVDEDFFTPNVEELLQGLTSPLKVVHNVAPAEIRKHLNAWKDSAVDEVRALEGMKGINRLRGKKAIEAAAQGDVQILPAKTVFTAKPGKGENYYRRKCRVVGCGNFEKKNPEHELFAGGIPADVLRACLINASAQGLQAWITDVKNAFLLAPIPEESGSKILLRPPKILEEMNITEPGELWEINRAVYGLRQSPRWWSIYRDKVLSEAVWNGPHGRTRLRQSSVESNLWFMVTDDGRTVGYMIVYVDDLMMLANSGDANALFAWIKENWECTPLQCATADEPITFLGVEIQESEGQTGFCLRQRGYIEELTRLYNTPIVHRASPLPREWTKEFPEQEVPQCPLTLRKAQKITGELLWIAQRSRPDIAHEVGVMSSWVTRAPTIVYKFGMRVLEFLNTTKDLSLSMTPVSGASKGIVIYTDASYAPYGGHSISGILVQYMGRNILWKSKRQSIVCLSTAEAELVAACEGVMLGQSTEALVKELTIIDEPMQLLVDNLAAIIISEGGGSGRTRHLRVRSCFIKDLVDKNELIVSHCPGDIQLADILTKVLGDPDTNFLENSWV